MKKLNVILDTDVYNQVDDIFAIFYLLANEKFFNINAITIAPYKVKHQPEVSISEGIKLSYLEAKKILNIANRNYPVICGADEFVSKAKKQNLATKFIIEQCNKNDFTYIIAIGAFTNLALALEQAPEIIEKAKVLWLGTSNLFESFFDTNFLEEPKAFEIVLNSGVDLTIVPTTASRCMRVSYAELKERLQESNIKTYLLETARNFCKFEGNGKSIILHDVLPIQVLNHFEDFHIQKVSKKVFPKNIAVKENGTLEYVAELDPCLAVNHFFNEVNNFIKG